MPLHREILVVPMVERLNRERAQAISGKLLAAVSQHATRVVVLEGCPGGVRHGSEGAPDRC